MKILFILDHPFPPNVRVENEMKALTDAGNDVHVACVQKDGEPFMALFIVSPCRSSSTSQVLVY